MSEETSSTSGAASEAGGDQTGKGSVAYETYQKVLREKKNRDEQLRAATEKLAAFELEKQEAEQAKLQEQGQFKTLLERETATRKATEEKLNTLQTGLQNSMKRQSLEEKLGGKLRKSEYAAFIPFSRIEMNLETMEIDEASLSAVAEEFQREHKSLFDFGTKGGIPNGNAPSSTATLSYESWLKLPLKEQREKMHLLTKK